MVTGVRADRGQKHCRLHSGTVCSTTLLSRHASTAYSQNSAEPEQRHASTASPSQSSVKPTQRQVSTAARCPRTSSSSFSVASSFPRAKGEMGSPSTTLYEPPRTVVSCKQQQREPGPRDVTKPVEQ